uniref:Uncharacterized protein n=1 Tax=Bactrocera dorsalis TaxID=27457 RepID=A0A034WRG3_BACDO
MDPKSIESLAFTFSKSLCKLKNKRTEKSKGKGKCHRPGPLMRNPYLNFLREFRKQNCGLTAVEIIKRGAQAWRAVPKEKRLRYIEEAFYAPKRKGCRGAQQSPTLSSCAPKTKKRKSIRSCSSKGSFYKKKPKSSLKRKTTTNACAGKTKRKSKKRPKKAKKAKCGQHKRRLQKRKLKLSKSNCKGAKKQRRIKKKPSKCA